MSGSEKNYGREYVRGGNMTGGNMSGVSRMMGGNMCGGFVRDSHRDTARQSCFFISLAGDSTKILPHNLCFESLLSVLLKMLKCSSRHIYVNMCRHVNLHK